MSKTPDTTNERTGFSTFEHTYGGKKHEYFRKYTKEGTNMIVHPDLQLDRQQTKDEKPREPSKKDIFLSRLKSQTVASVASTKGPVDGSIEMGGDVSDFTQETGEQVEGIYPDMTQGPTYLTQLSDLYTQNTNHSGKVSDPSSYKYKTVDVKFNATHRQLVENSPEAIYFVLDDDVLRQAFAHLKYHSGEQTLSEEKIKEESYILLRDVIVQSYESDSHFTLGLDCRVLDADALVNGEWVVIGIPRTNGQIINQHIPLNQGYVRHWKPVYDEMARLLKNYSNSVFDSESMKFEPTSTTGLEQYVILEGGRLFEIIECLAKIDTLVNLIFTAMTKAKSVLKDGKSYKPVGSEKDWNGLKTKIAQTYEEIPMSKTAIVFQLVRPGLKSPDDLSELLHDKVARSDPNQLSDERKTEILDSRFDVNVRILIQARII